MRKSRAEKAGKQVRRWQLFRVKLVYCVVQYQVHVEPRVEYPTPLRAICSGLATHVYKQCLQSSALNTSSIATHLPCLLSLPIYGGSAEDHFDLRTFREPPFSYVWRCIGCNPVTSSSNRFTNSVYSRQATCIWYLLHSRFTQVYVPSSDHQFLFEILSFKIFNLVLNRCWLIAPAVNACHRQTKIPFQEVTSEKTTNACEAFKLKFKAHFDSTETMVDL